MKDHFFIPGDHLMNPSDSVVSLGNHYRHKWSPDNPSDHFMTPSDDFITQSDHVMTMGNRLITLGDDLMRTSDTVMTQAIM